LAPQPADLSHARGVYPTVKGDIAVEWRRGKRDLEVSVTIPDGAEGDVIAPPGYETAPGETRLGPGVHVIKFKEMKP
jgi:hypothetical protein